MKARVETTVCDLRDGRVASPVPVTWKRNGRSITNDLCEEHVAMLEANGHAPTRGPKPGSRRKGVTAKRTTQKRRGRPPKKQSAKRKSTTKRSTTKRKTTKRKRPTKPEVAQPEAA